MQPAVTISSRSGALRAHKLLASHNLQALWLSPQSTELISPQIFSLILENLPIPPTHKLYDSSDLAPRVLLALQCNFFQIRYNGTAFLSLQNIARQYNASLQKIRPPSFPFNDRNPNEEQTLLHYLKQNPSR